MIPIHYTKAKTVNQKEEQTTLPQPKDKQKCHQFKTEFKKLKAYNRSN